MAVLLASGGAVILILVYVAVIVFEIAALWHGSAEYAGPAAGGSRAIEY
jgi:hypothetical protein